MGIADEYHKTETLGALLHCWIMFGYLLVTDGRPFHPYLRALDGGLPGDTQLLSLSSLSFYSILTALRASVFLIMHAEIL